MNSHTVPWNLALVSAHKADAAAAENGAKHEEQIRALMMNRVKALTARDIPASPFGLDPGALLCGAVTKPGHSGSHAIRRSLAEGFSSFQGPIVYEVTNLRIAVFDDVAFCHSLNRGAATQTNGRQIDKWWCATVFFRKIQSNWAITDEHSSLAFDVNNASGGPLIHEQQCSTESPSVRLLGSHPRSAQNRNSGTTCYEPWARALSESKHVPPVKVRRHSL
jgi:ketosteroid isomerase-like protein